MSNLKQDNKSGLVQEHFDNTENYLKNNLVISLRHQLIHGFLKDIKNKSILDIGCGNGLISIPYLNGNKVTFLDVSGKMLEIAQSNIPNENIKNASFRNEDLFCYQPDFKFDIIICMGVVAHIEDTGRFYTKIKDLLEINGIIIIQNTNKNNMISQFIHIIGLFKNIFHKHYNYKITRLSSKQFIKITESNQLKVTQKFNYWAALPGFVLLPVAVRKFLYYKIFNCHSLINYGGETIFIITK
jgi:2-polyprenyl-3-methyl-5-hydroxy-6-metoxy-1,4-benzoquinol methylase